MDWLEKRGWVEVDLDKLRHNYQVIQHKVGENCSVMAIVKANAYGHGDEFVSKTLENIGCNWFGVSNLKEGIHLREKGVKGNILNLGYLSHEDIDKAIFYNIQQTVINYQHGCKLKEELSKLKKPLQCHLKIDTGMGRLGFDMVDRDSLKDILEMVESPYMDCVGIFTHFSVADSKKEEDMLYTKHQYQTFSNLLDRLTKVGYTFPYVHCCNSAAIFIHDTMHFNMVRPGTVLYGLSPSGDILASSCGLQQVVSLKSVVSSIKYIKEGRDLSYGRNFQSSQEQKVATVSIGYADGYSRALSNQGFVEINGSFAPILGNICMDQCIVDVTHIEQIKMGDVVTVVGEGDTPNGIHTMANKIHTIDIELSCEMGKRLPRIYKELGQQVGIVEY